MRPTVVFCGPTISKEDVELRMQAICLPPAVQGSFVEAVLEHDPAVMVLIDGGFQSEPAIKHKEILWAMSRGVVVVGASSMGALRAAELAPYMIGVGLIYRWYRRFALAADDAVAVLHGPADVNFTPITTALLDLRLTFRAAFRKGYISRQMKLKLETTAKNLNFRERTLNRCIADASLGEDIQHVRAVLERALVRQKHHDAVTAINLVGQRAFKPPASLPPFELTRAYVADLTDFGLDVDILGDLTSTNSFT